MSVMGNVFLPARSVISTWTVPMPQTRGLVVSMIKINEEINKVLNGHLWLLRN